MNMPHEPLAPIRYVVAYIATAVIFFGLDAAWLSTMSQLLYRPLLGDALTDQLRIAPAIAFYAIYVAGIVLFAISPGLDAKNWLVALTRGAALGCVAYAAYDLTNMATLKHWPAVITWADLAWGTVATAAAAGLGYFVTARMV
jgi:uncharacterized membrane protein